MKYLIYQILVVLVVGLLIYALFSPYMKEGKENEKETNIENLLSYLEKSKQFYSKDFNIVHEDYQKLSNNITINSTLELNKKGNKYYVYLKRDFIEWKAINGKEKVICFSFGYEEKCANISNNSLQKDFVSLSSSLPSKEWIENLFISKYDKLNKFGGLKEIREEEKNINNFQCKNFEITYSYKDLTVPELRSIGINPNSVVVVVDEIKDNICIGEDGKIVYKSTEFSYKGKTANEHFLLLSYNPPKNIPYLNLTKPSEVEREKSIANQFFGEYKKCNDDMCLRAIAIKYAMPSLCEKAENYTACLDAYSAFAKSEKGCKYFYEKNLTVPPICEETTTPLNDSLNTTLNNTNNSMEG